MRFALAILKGEFPTLLFYNSQDYVTENKLNIDEVFHIQFTFGFRGTRLCLRA